MTTNVIAEIQYFEDNGQWFVRLCSDGHELDRWGPFIDQSNAADAAQTAAKMAREIAVKRGGFQITQGK